MQQVISASVATIQESLRREACAILPYIEAGISRHDSGELEAERRGRCDRAEHRASVATIQESLRREEFGYGKGYNLAHQSPRFRRA